MNEPARDRIAAWLPWTGLVLMIAVLSVPLVRHPGPHTSHALCGAFGSIYSENCIAPDAKKR